MALAKKLQIKEGQKVRIYNAPKGLDLGDLSRTTGKSAPVVLLFVRTMAELEEQGEVALAAAREEKLAWIAYPKGGKLETDLNRDSIWRAIEPKGVRPVRQVAFDAVWSAIRLMPA